VFGMSRLLSEELPPRMPEECAFEQDLSCISALQMLFLLYCIVYNYADTDIDLIKAFVCFHLFSASI